ncbi:MAG: mechanosensitive ion channel [Tateyamaria sp.]|jgi:miniconductance mechanosensitive channel|nr:mechanosensitive ion channel [Tateyamaria sp.]MBT7446531.1 mechanosensitive ion channel [Tateyamaria sp.]
MILPSWAQEILNQQWAQVTVSLIALIMAAIVVNYIVQKLLLRGLERLIKGTQFANDKEIRRHNVIPRLANIIPALVISYGISYSPTMPEIVSMVLLDVVNAFIIAMLSMATIGGLSVINTIYERRGSKSRPITNFIQGAKIIILIGAGLLIVAQIGNKSISEVLLGLGAMAAVLTLIFRDSILSFIAGVQIAFSDTIRVGDWLSVPSQGADGTVVEISLYFVQIQNFDKTIAVIPIQKLVNESFKNWRGMTQSGGRRIKRYVSIDQTTVTFLNNQQLENLKKIEILETYINDKDSEISQWNKTKSSSSPVNTRQLTNIGTFRAYLTQYLKFHPRLQNKMTMMVRQLPSSQVGIPIEIYCFTDTTDWGDYEDIQADIFDHILAVLPTFELSVYQDVGGYDVRRLQNRPISKL